jgi:hypothetical protein
MVGIAMGAEHACNASEDQEPLSYRDDVSQIETEVEKTRVGAGKPRVTSNCHRRFRCGARVSRQCDLREGGS